jgi:hypothetical protein
MKAFMAFVTAVAAMGACVVALFLWFYRKARASQK